MIHRYAFVRCMVSTRCTQANVSNTTKGDQMCSNSMAMQRVHQLLTAPHLNAVIQQILCLSIELGTVEVCKYDACMYMHVGAHLLILHKP